MNSHRLTRRYTRGFSLLEVVVAFAILGLALGVLSPVFSATVKRATGVQETRRAVALAESKVTELASANLAAGDLESGQSDGRYRWQRRVERINAGGPPDRPASSAVAYRITVEVMWGPGANQAGGVEGNPRSVVLTTVRMGTGE